MAIREEAVHIEILAGFERALDDNFRRIRESARAQWQSYFAGTDASDACVTVRINVAGDAQLTRVAGAGFLPHAKPPRRGKMRPRLA